MRRASIVTTKCDVCGDRLEDTDVQTFAISNAYVVEACGACSPSIVKIWEDAVRNASHRVNDLRHESTMKYLATGRKR